MMNPERLFKEIDLLLKRDPKSNHFSTQSIGRRKLRKKCQQLCMEVIPRGQKLTSTIITKRLGVA